jgi:hypothetical protein
LRPTAIPVFPLKLPKMPFVIVPKLRIQRPCRKPVIDLSKYGGKNKKKFRVQSEALKNLFRDTDFYPFNARRIFLRGPFLICWRVSPCFLLVSPCVSGKIKKKTRRKQGGSKAKQVLFFPQ